VLSQEKMTYYFFYEIIKFLVLLNLNTHTFYIYLNTDHNKEKLHITLLNIYEFLVSSDKNFLQFIQGWNGLTLPSTSQELQLADAAHKFN